MELNLLSATAIKSMTIGMGLGLELGLGLGSDWLWGSRKDNCQPTSSIGPRTGIVRKEHPVGEKQRKERKESK